jgi:hypothetical protein
MSVVALTPWPSPLPPLQPTPQQVLERLVAAGFEEGKCSGSAEMIRGLTKIIVARK